VAVDRESSYPDLASAQDFTQRTVNRSTVAIRRWLGAGTAARLALTGYFPGEATGRVQSAAMLYAGRGAFEVSSARVVLQRDHQAATGCRVAATYPVEPWSEVEVPDSPASERAAPPSAGLGLEPGHWYARFAALADLLDAYAGQGADDAPGTPSFALTAYLETEGAADPTRPVLAAAQARELAADGVLESDSFLALQILPRPIGHGAERDFLGWLRIVADLCDHYAAAGYPKPNPVPRTGWQWRRAFPHLHQLFACYLGQEFDTEFGASAADPAGADADPFGAPHDAALAAWSSTASALDTGCLLGEVVQFVRLELDQARLARGLSELGLYAQPPVPPQLWAQLLAERVGRYAGFELRVLPLS
jgi:hypothetical protein